MMLWWMPSFILLLCGIAALLLATLLSHKDVSPSSSNENTQKEEKEIPISRPQQALVTYSTPTGRVGITTNLADHRILVTNTIAELATEANSRISDLTSDLTCSSDDASSKNLIPALIYINMSKNPDRDHMTQVALKDLNIPSKTTKVFRFEGIAVPENGAKGCYLSHVHILAWAAKNLSGSHILCMEDDVQWNVSSWAELNDYVSEADKVTNGRWDVIVLGQYVKEWQQLNGTERVFRLFQSTTTSAYILNALYVEELVFKWYNILQPLLPLDKFKHEHNLDQVQIGFQSTDIWLGFNKALAGQRAGKSIIGGVWADNQWTCSKDFKTWYENGHGHRLVLRPRASPTKRIAVCLVATGRYKQFLPNVMKSCVQHMCKPNKLEFHVITDVPEEVPDKIDGCSITKYSTPRLGFPGDTLYRYHYMLKAEEALKQVDYIFYMDADYWVCNSTDTDALLVDGGLVATSHVRNLTENGDLPVESNPKSTAYVPLDKTPALYYCGGFQGGSSAAYLEACRTIKDNIDQDDANHIIAVWHDESHWNRYLLDNPPTVVMSQSYMFPEQCLYDPSQFNGKLSQFNIYPIMVALEKNHDRVREKTT